MPDLWMDVDTALSEVPVNVLPLIDDTDFKTRETGIAYNQAGMDLVWNFVTANGAMTQTAVTPTTGGDYDWSHQGGGMYSIEIPASGGASINNNTAGVGWFAGDCTGVLPWRGPFIGFRDSDLNDKLIESAWSTTRGLAGTALPNAAADAAGGLPVSDAGGLDLDAQIGTDIDAILVDTSTTLDNFVDNLESRLGVPSNLGSGATIAANLVDIEGQTDDIGAAGAGLTAVPWNSAWDAEVQSGCTDALNAYDPPTDAEMDAAFAALNDISVADVLAGTVEGSLTLQQVLRLALAALAGKSTGGGTTTVTFRDNADSKARITATVDASGNRTAMTLDGS